MAVKLNAKLRKDHGKGAARKLRQRGEIPAVAYGHGQQSQSLSVNALELERLLSTINPENTIIDLTVDGGKATPALIREVQHHPSRPFIFHIDFFKVRAGERIHVEIPIRLQGIPVGVREEGGVLQEVLRVVSVECLPADIPQQIELDITHLPLGGVIHVSDVQLERVTVLNEPSLVICTVAMPSAAVLPEEEKAEAAGEAVAEPEVISGRRGAEEGEGE